MPRKNEDPTVMVMTGADSIGRATDFFKPVWAVPEARASAEEETQRQATLENGGLDGEG